MKNELLSQRMYLHSFLFGVLTLFEVTSLTKGIYEAERPVTIYWGRILFLKHDRVSLRKKITPDKIFIELKQRSSWGMFWSEHKGLLGHV